MESFEIGSAAAVDENWMVTSGKIRMIENNTKTNTEEEETYNRELRICRNHEVN